MDRTADISVRVPSIARR